MLKITLQNLQEKVPVGPLRIKKSVMRILKKESGFSDCHINIVFAGESLLRNLNKKFHKDNRATDVLAFDLSLQKDKPNWEIVISCDTAVRNSSEFKTSTSYELNLYAIHGILHLLGYDDGTIAKAKTMRRKELEYVHT